MCNIVVTEVDVLNIWGWLVVTCDICDSGDGVLLSQHLKRQHGDEAERLAPLVAHQTHGALIHYLVESHQALVPFMLHPSKVILQVSLQFPLLLSDVGEVDEEARAHVALHLLHVCFRRGSEPSHQQVAVLQ